MIELLFEKFGNIVDICIIQYIANYPDINQLNDMSTSEYSMLFFRTFYFFYVIIKYTNIIDEFNAFDEFHESNKFDKANKSQMKDIFFKYFDYSMNKTRQIDNLRIIFVEKYDYLYEIFFVQNNVYFNTYFNNLIKYFLPLPYKILTYAPVISYRANINNICKNNNIDYLDTINKIDFIRLRAYVKRKNIDMIKNELDFHLPLHYFSNKLFDKDNLFLIAAKNNKNYDLMIIDKLSILNDHEWNCNVIYHRNYTKIDDKMMYEGLCFELIFQLWKKKLSNNTKLKTNKVVYVSVFEKIKKEDLFNVFPKINLNYSKLYHNTGLTMTIKEAEKKLAYPTFFYPDTLGYNDEYFKDRKCIIYDVEHKIKNVLDVSRSIVTYNEIVNTEKTKNEICITNENIDLDTFLKQRPECDIQNPSYYVGRRKLQEILYKTRKYDSSKIWIYDYQQELANKIIEKYKGSDDYPKILYKNIYHNSLKYKIGFIISDYDSYILNDINVTGFFSTDYHSVWNKGGEIMLTKPYEYIKVNTITNTACNGKIYNESSDHTLNNLSHDLSNDTLNELIYTPALDAEVKRNIKFMIIGNKYRIIGSYRHKKFITDIDITNYLHTDYKFGAYVIQNLLKRLPKHITFIYMSLATKYNIDELISINWELSKRDKIEIISINYDKLSLIDKQIFGGNGVIKQLLDTNIYEAYLFLKDNAKIKWSENDIMKGYKKCGNVVFQLTSLLNHSPILHYIIKYGGSFIIFDVAIYHNIEHEPYKNTKYLSYYNKEWFYILYDISKLTTDTQIKKDMSNILHKYDIIKQITMQLYYMEYLVADELISITDFIMYNQFIINNIKKLGFKDQIIYEMIKCINDVKTKKINMSDIHVINTIHLLNVKTFAFVNESLEEKTKYYISLLTTKPPYYHLTY